MFKRIIITIISILFIISLISCGKKEKPKEIIFNGSVMLFSDMDVEIVKSIKADFESTYKGLVLDYFNGNINDVQKKIYEAYDLDLPEADIILTDNESIFNQLTSKNWLSQYESKEIKSINDEYKIKDNDYYVVCTKNYDKYKAGILSNSLNVDNAKLFIDYLLSKKGQELLVNNGMQSVRKDIK